MENKFTQTNPLPCMRKGMKTLSGVEVLRIARSSHCRLSSTGRVPQYDVRSSTHVMHLDTAINRLLGRELFIDVTLACDGHKFQCHRLVLAASSPLFEELLKRNPTEHPIVILPVGIKSQTLKSLIDFMYKGQTNASQTELKDLIESAELLQVTALYNGDSEFREYYEEDEENFLDQQEEAQANELQQYQQVSADQEANPEQETQQEQVEYQRQTFENENIANESESANTQDQMPKEWIVDVIEIEDSQDAPTSNEEDVPVENEATVVASGAQIPDTTENRDCAKNNDGIPTNSPSDSNTKYIAVNNNDDRTITGDNKFLQISTSQQHKMPQLNATIIPKTHLKEEIKLINLFQLSGLPTIGGQARKKSWTYIHIANPPSSQVLVPSTSTQVPSTSTQVPSTSTQVPSISTQVPTTSTQVPSTSTQVPSTSTQLLSTSTKVRSTSTKVRPTSTKVRSTSSQVRSISTQVLSTSAKVPSTSTQVPSTSTQVTSTSTQIASTSTQIASTSTQIASTSTQIASTSTQVASISTQVLSTNNQLALLCDELPKLYYPPPQILLNHLRDVDSVTNPIPVPTFLKYNSSSMSISVKNLDRTETQERVKVVNMAMETEPEAETPASWIYPQQVIDKSHVKSEYETPAEANTIELGDTLVSEADYPMFYAMMKKERDEKAAKLAKEKQEAEAENIICQPNVSYIYDGYDDGKDMECDENEDGVCIDYDRLVAETYGYEEGELQQQQGKPKKNQRKRQLKPKKTDKPPPSFFLQEHLSMPKCHIIKHPPTRDPPLVMHDDLEPNQFYYHDKLNTGNGETMFSKSRSIFNTVSNSPSLREGESHSPQTVILRNPRCNQPRHYSTDSLYNALMAVKYGESIYRASRLHQVPRKTLRNWMKRWDIKSQFPMPKQLEDAAKKKKQNQSA